MKKFEEMTYNERNEIVELFSNWLKDYTHEAILRVMEKRDEVIENEFAMNLLKELYNREEKESDDFNHSIALLLDNYEDFKDNANLVITDNCTILSVKTDEDFSNSIDGFQNIKMSINIRK